MLKKLLITTALVVWPFIPVMAQEGPKFPDSTIGMITPEACPDARKLTKDKVLSTIKSEDEYTMFMMAEADIARHPAILMTYNMSRHSILMLRINWTDDFKEVVDGCILSEGVLDADMGKLIVSERERLAHDVQKKMSQATPDPLTPPPAAGTVPTPNFQENPDE